MLKTYKYIGRKYIYYPRDVGVLVIINFIKNSNVSRIYMLLKDVFDLLSRKYIYILFKCS